MKVFVAGATGVIGRQLVPRLLKSGHQVVGSTRTESGVVALAKIGADGVVLDALNADDVAKAIAGAEPDVIVNQLTAIGSIDMRHFDRSFAATNLLRTRGTDHLLSAGHAVGVSAFVTASYTGWPYAPVGGPVKTETDPLDSNPAKGMSESLEALKHLEQVVTSATWTRGVVLRYGAFYGPGTSMAPGGEQLELIRKRKFPIVGKGTGVWSFIHVVDAAEATVRAVEGTVEGIYNIVDDEPARVSDWLPEIARQLGAKAPQKVPTWMGRLAAGPAAVRMLTEIRGASNEKAKQDLQWRLNHPTWRRGLVS